MAKKGTNIYLRAASALRTQLEIGEGEEFDVVTDSAGSDERASRAAQRFLFRLGAIEGNQRALFERRLASIAANVKDDLGEPESVVLSVLSLFGGSAEEEGTGVCLARPLCDECTFRPECAWAQKTPTIRDLPPSERPRERLIKDGAESLSDAELLGIIIRDGQTNRTAVDIAKSLLSKSKTLRDLAARTIGELCETPGIGEAKAAQLKAALSLGQRLSLEAGLQRGDPLSSSEAVYRTYHARLRDKLQEEFHVVLLDRANKVIQDVLISVGSLSATIVHPREVLRPAIRHSASAFICVHNHPSGDPKPSKQDLEITTRLKEAGAVMGIPLLDHIVVGEGRYYSFADEGLLK